MNANRTGLMFLTLAVLSYGGLWPVMRVTVELMPPTWFAVTRIFVGAVFLFVLLGLTGRLRLPRRPDLPAVISVGIFMMGGYVCLVHFALQFVPAGRGALLAYTTPLWVAPAAVLLLGEKFTRLRLAGLALGLAGLGVLFNPAGFDWSDTDVLLGNGLLLLAALSWSVALLQMRGHRWRLTPLQLGPWQLLLATIFALPLAIGLEGTPHITWSRDLLLLVAYGGLIGTAIAMWATASTLRYLPAATTSIGLLGVPVVATTLGIVFLDEPLTFTLAAGFALIIAGLACVSLAGAQS